MSRSQQPMTWAAIRLPAFPLAVLRRQKQLPKGRPLAVADGDREISPIIAADRAARNGGVGLGMTAARAHSFCADLLVLPRDHDREIIELGKLFTALQQFSPVVEEDDGARFFLSLNGMGGLFPDPAAMAREMIDMIQTAGYPAAIGVAPNRPVARIAARTVPPREYVLVTPDHVIDFLNPLAVEHLELADDINESLFDLGIRTIGQLLAFPVNELAQRFGRAAWPHLWSTIRELPAIDTQPSLADDELVASVSLEYGLATRQDLLRYVREQLSTLFETLRRHELGCLSFTLELRTERRRDFTCTVTMDKPTRSIVTAIRQAAVRLEELPSMGRIVDITVRITGTERLLAPQTNLGDSTATANNTSLHLPGKLHYPRLNNALLPEQSFILSNDDKPTRRLSILPEPVQGHLYALGELAGLRLYRPPQPVQVHTEHGRLCSLTADRRTARITKQYGPWKLSGNWWSGLVSRAYYQVVTADRRRCLLFYDRTRAGWFLHGAFD